MRFYDTPDTSMGPSHYWFWNPSIDIICYIYITAVVISSAFTITDEKFWLFNLAFIVSIYTPGARIWTPDYLVTWEL